MHSLKGDLKIFLRQKSSANNCSFKKNTLDKLFAGFSEHSESVKECTSVYSCKNSSKHVNWPGLSGGFFNATIYSPTFNHKKLGD